VTGIKTLLAAEVRHTIESDYINRQPILKLLWVLHSQFPNSSTVFELLTEICNDRYTERHRLETMLTVEKPILDILFVPG
jgi:hypothetical protein